jgi:hypothetical protein
MENIVYDKNKINLMLAGMYYSQSMLLYDICGGLTYRLSFFHLRIPITHNAVSLGESYMTTSVSRRLNIHFCNMHKKSLKIPKGSS